MLYTTLMTCAELSRHLDDRDWAIVDCRFTLSDTEQGRRAYQQSHIPGALYAHLDEDLSGPIIPGQTGRHPLPAVNVVAKTLSHWGIDSQVQVVAYDDMGGAIAARLWWMLRWLGHAGVAVLDGGWQLWQRQGFPTRSEVVVRPARTFTPQPRPELILDTPQVLRRHQDPDWCLLDARSAERFRGENETLDPIAGHIPGAISAPYAQNLGLDGRFLPVEALRTHYNGLLDNTPPEQAVVYCGSGVTAAHNLLAMARAGLDGARLYAGSWSEWVAKPETRELVKRG